MSDLQEFNEDIGLLAEAGLMAIKQGDEESAKKLFNAVGILQPDSSTKKMGYGLIAVHKMDIKGAKKIFGELFEKDPNNRRAQAFLAFSCMLSLMMPGGDDEEKKLALTEGAKHANEALAHADDASTKQLAQSVLDWQAELNKAEA